MKIKSEIELNLIGNNWIKEYNEFLKKVKERKKELEPQISNYDLQEQDILHYIEIKKCDAIISSKLMKKLKEIRQKRRIVKEEYNALKSISDSSRKSKYKNNPTYEFNTSVVTDLLEDIINDEN